MICIRIEEVIQNWQGNILHLELGLSIFMVNSLGRGYLVVIVVPYEYHTCLRLLI